MVIANDNDWQLPEEVWLPIPSRPGIEASSHGRIRQLPFVGRMPHGGLREYAGKPRFGSVTYASKDARHLYFSTRIMGRNLKIHFAVCEAFHGRNPKGTNGVRHLNENGLDNRPENLVWSDRKTNLNDPDIKWFHRHRVSPHARDPRPPREKRAGLYDSIKDIGMFQLERRAANDNVSKTIVPI